jgi:hypothetical protein
MVTVKRYGMLLRDTVELEPGETESLNFVCGALDISVKGAKGRALRADIDLLRSGDRMRVTSGRTDSDGNLVLVVPPGDYLVVAKHKQTSVSRDGVPCFSELTTLVPLWQFGALRAQSVGKNGAPLQSEVTVYDQVTGRTIESSRCDADGETIFDLSSGIYMTRTRETNEIVHRGIQIVSGREQVFDVMGHGDVIENSPPGIADILVHPIQGGLFRGAYELIVRGSDPDGDRVRLGIDAPSGWIWYFGLRRIYVPRDPADSHPLIVSVNDGSHEPVVYELDLPLSPALTKSLAVRLRWAAMLTTLIVLGVVLVVVRLLRKRRSHG